MCDVLKDGISKRKAQTQWSHSLIIQQQDDRSRFQKRQDVVLPSPLISLSFVRSNPWLKYSIQTLSSFIPSASRHCLPSAMMRVVRCLLVFHTTINDVVFVVCLCPIL
jgi:hypothetical protein